MLTEDTWRKPLCFRGINSLRRFSAMLRLGSCIEYWNSREAGCKLLLSYHARIWVFVDIVLTEQNQGSCPSCWEANTDLLEHTSLLLNCMSHKLPTIRTDGLDRFPNMFLLFISQVTLQRQMPIKAYSFWNSNPQNKSLKWKNIPLICVWNNVWLVVSSSLQRKCWVSSSLL